MIMVMHYHRHIFGLRFVIFFRRDIIKVICFYSTQNNATLLLVGLKFKDQYQHNSKNIFADLKDVSHILDMILDTCTSKSFAMNASLLKMRGSQKRKI